MNKKVFETYHLTYKHPNESKDDRHVWKMIDWSGNTNTEPPKNPPSVFELSDHFAKLYEPIDDEENLHSLKSSVNIPITDDPITPKEICDASREMKKGGYDYPSTVLRVLISTILPVIVLLLNTILFSSYPSKLAISILSVIPKIGNLSLPTNYRGIQIQPLIANLYDRVGED